MGGVNFVDKNDSFIGQNVIFDSLYPENILIGKHAVITMGCILLTHNINTNGGITYRKTKIVIGSYSFIGARTIICGDVEIGDHSIIGAGSVVTKNVPSNQVWAGNPAKFIKNI